MSTTPIRCPYCSSLLRVAVQPSQITRTEAWPDGQQLLVKFDDQLVAHICHQEVSDEPTTGVIMGAI